MDTTEVEKWIKLAKKHKLKHFTVDNVSFELREPTKRTRLRAVTQGDIKLTGERMPTDEELLYWSSDSGIQQTS